MENINSLPTLEREPYLVETDNNHWQLYQQWEPQVLDDQWDNINEGLDKKWRI